jgi:glycosyltransferase involved in cell wall biosynthesis
MRLAIITTHPIQYYSPVFKLLHERYKIEIKVFYTWGEKSLEKYDPGFNKKIEWDIPVLEGFPYEWVKNESKYPGSHHFKGIINPGLIDQITSWKPDALLIYGWGYNSHLKALRYFKNKIPVFFRGDSTLLDEKTGVRSVLKSIFLKWVYRHVDYALYVGSNSKAYYKKYGLKENQLGFVPHAIDNSRFAVYNKEETLSLKRKLGINDDELVVMFAGKLEEKKSPELLLEAFIALKRPGTHLLFVGNGPLENRLKLKAGGNTNIHFMDFQNQSQMPVIYGVCNIFCLPSKGPGESWGLAINEAMACGKAILASDKVGAAADLVTPGKNGRIFKAGSLNNLLTNLEKLLDSGKEGLLKMGECSKKIIKDWDFETQVNAIELIVNNKPGYINNNE